MNDRNKEELEAYKKSIIGSSCAFEGCLNSVEGYIRTKLVCKKHFNKIRTDNKKRIKLSIGIEDSLKLY